MYSLLVFLGMPQGFSREILRIPEGFHKDSFPRAIGIPAVGIKVPVGILSFVCIFGGLGFIRWFFACCSYRLLCVRYFYVLFCTCCFVSGVYPSFCICCVHLLLFLCICKEGEGEKGRRAAAMGKKERIVFRF